MKPKLPIPSRGHFPSTPKSRPFYNAFRFCQTFFRPPKIKPHHRKPKKPAKTLVKPSFASPSPPQSNQVSDEERRILQHYQLLSRNYFSGITKYFTQAAGCLSADNFLPSHIRAQCLWHGNRSIFVLIIFHNRNQGSTRSQTRSV